MTHTFDGTNDTCPTCLRDCSDCHCAELLRVHWARTADTEATDSRATGCRIALALGILMWIGLIECVCTVLEILSEIQL